MRIDERTFTVAEFEQFLGQPEQQGRRLELIHGQIIEKMPTEEHGMITLLIGSRILLFVQDKGLGRVAVEVRHRVEGDETTSIIPDISFISAERALPVVKEGAVPQMPDLAVEVKSPTDTYTQLREKAAYYLAHGGRMVWLIFPEKKIAEVVQTGQDIQLLVMGDAIDGGDVLPGFRLPLAELFTT